MTVVMMVFISKRVRGLNLSCKGGFGSTPAVHLPNESTGFLTGSEISNKRAASRILGNRVADPDAKESAVAAVVVLSNFECSAKVYVVVLSHNS